jgi:ABC transporter substrate binding protein
LTGGNLTGVNFFSTELAAKRLELLRALVPGAARVAVLGNAMRAEATVKDVQAAAAAMGLQIQVVGASTRSEINAAFATFARERPDALFVGTDPFLRRAMPTGGVRTCQRMALTNSAIVTPSGRRNISIRRGKRQASMRIAPQLLAKLVTLDLAGRRARQILGNFEPPRPLVGR